MKRKIILCMTFLCMMSGCNGEEKDNSESSYLDESPNMYVWQKESETENYEKASEIPQTAEPTLPTIGSIENGEFIKQINTIPRFKEDDKVESTEISDDAEDIDSEVIEQTQSQVEKSTQSVSDDVPATEEKHETNEKEKNQKSEDENKLQKPHLTPVG